MQFFRNSTKHRRCTVPSCLFLLLLLIYGKAVLEPVVLGAIKHQPSKLHAPRSQNKTAGETHTQGAEYRDH